MREVAQVKVPLTASEPTSTAHSWCIIPDIPMHSQAHMNIHVSTSKHKYVYTCVCLYILHPFLITLNIPYTFVCV